MTKSIVDRSVEKDAEQTYLKYRATNAKELRPVTAEEEAMGEASEQLGWRAAKDHFDAVRKQYQDMEGLPGVHTALALRLTFDPLARRYNVGERTRELYDAMMGVE